jgi:membrane protein
MPMIFKRTKEFLYRDIWRIRTKKLPRQKYLIINYLRVILLALREFQSNRCQLNASALSFYLLLSIVPLVAMSFGIAKGFGFDQLFEKQLLLKFPGQEQSITQIITFANNFLTDIHGGIIAGVSVIVLFWTVIQVLNSIEMSFNEIWGIKTSRSFSRKISDYLSMMLIGPFFLIISSAVTVFLNTQLTMLVKHLTFLGVVDSMILCALNLLPYVVIWFLFTFIYIFMPNTKVRLSSAAIGGVIAGTIYQLVQVLYIQSQIRVGTINVIYGSFAALPLFLVWLQISWRVVLFGAEVSFAHQNVETYEFEQDCLMVSHSFKHLLSLYVATILVKRFVNGQPPLSAVQISDLLDIPIRLVQDILFELTETGIVTEIRERAERQPFYQLGRDSHDLTIAFVSDRLNQRGTRDIPVPQTETLLELQKSLLHFEDVIKKLPNNKLLKDIE